MFSSINIEVFIESYKPRLWADKILSLRFLGTLAHDKGFHPLVDSGSWYDVTVQDVVLRQVITRWILFI